MANYEKEKINKIDQLILQKLKENLEIKEENSNILKDDILKQVYKTIEKKKQTLYLLYDGDFSVNEYKIERRLAQEKNENTMYTEIANNIIARRINLIIETLIKEEPENGMLISVCMDRKLFMEKVLEKNVEPAFILKYAKVEDKENSK